MRALGFDVKKPEVVKMVHDVDPANSGAVDYLQFLEISKLNRNDQAILRCGLSGCGSSPTNFFHFVLQWRIDTLSETPKRRS